METANRDSLQDTGFEVEVALQEDIGAELDYFVFLTLLGIDGEASEFASTVLWRHLRYFPVTAEIAGYLVSRNDIDLLKRLWDCLENDHVRFDDAQETLLLAHIEQIVRDEDAAARSWGNRMSRLLGAFDDWESPISSLILEIETTIVARHIPKPRIPDMIELMLRHCRRLLDRQMPEESTRMLSIICSIALDENFELLGLENLFTDTFKQLIQPESYKLPEDENELAYGSLVFLKYLNLRVNMSKDTLSDPWIQALLQKTEGVLAASFEKLPNPRPRGRHFEFCVRLRGQLAENEIKRNDGHIVDLEGDRLKTHKSEIEEHWEEDPRHFEPVFQYRARSNEATEQGEQKQDQLSPSKQTNLYRRKSKLGTVTMSGSRAWVNCIGMLYQTAYPETEADSQGVAESAKSQRKVFAAESQREADSDEKIAEVDKRAVLEGGVGSGIRPWNLSQQRQYRRNRPLNLNNHPWGPYYDEIRTKYVDENLTLDQLMQYMRTTHQFAPGKKQYISFLNKYNIRKNDKS